MQLTLLDGLDGALRPYRHKNGRLDRTVVRVEDSRASIPVGLLEFKVHDGE
jgi:hypothetical protein